MYRLNPDGLIANKARILQADRVKRSIIYLISECSKKLKLEDNNIKLACSHIEHMTTLFPEIHFFHHRLQTSMRSQDPANARLYLAKIIQEILKENHFNQDISVTSIGDTEWENFIVAEAIRLTKQDCKETAEIESISNNELRLAKDSISTALNIIERHDPDMFDELNEQVQLIKLFNGKVTMGFTDVRILGAMLLRLPRENIDPILYFIEHIIHEASHMHLNCLMVSDPLILNLPDERFISPLRPDPRPMLGVYHAAYVSAKISRTFLKLYLATNNKNVLHPLAETLDETIRGVSEIEKNAKLTSYGEQMIASIKAFIESAKKLPEWKEYLFMESRIHRFGIGETKVNSLYKAVA